MEIVIFDMLVWHRNLPAATDELPDPNTTLVDVSLFSFVTILKWAALDAIHPWWDAVTDVIFALVECYSFFDLSCTLVTLGLIAHV